MTKRDFSIRADLKGRKLDEQIEILLTSGPNSHNPKWVSKKLGVSLKRVEQVAASSARYNNAAVERTRRFREQERAEFESRRAR